MLFRMNFLRVLGICLLFGTPAISPAQALSEAVKGISDPQATRQTQALFENLRNMNNPDDAGPICVALIRRFSAGTWANWQKVRYIILIPFILKT